TIQSTDKYMWSQARGLWTFSALYNRIEPRDEWLDIAHGLFRFLRHHGRDGNGCWLFLVDAEGNRLQGPESIVTDAFAVLGLVEYHRATGNEEALRIALETYDSVMERLAQPYTYGTAPYPTPKGTRPHREPMQFSFAFWQLAKATGDQRVRRTALEMSERIARDHYREDHEVVLEYIGNDGEPVDSDYGRAMVPGHGIESAYFMIRINREARRPELSQAACRAMRWCVEKGWDHEYGGLLLGIDVEGKRPVYWRNAEKKLWWAHAEALAGLLVAYEQCGEDWCLDWYHRVHEWSFAHFPVPGHGEWTQRLDREGNRITTLIALPVKDPFHLPRALIVAIETLERLTGRSPAPEG
ncbi:MAG: AGE family epimerase/isomerase, partial [Planctomycetota bacterium]